MTDIDTKYYAPGADFLLALAQATVANLPDPFRAKAKSVTLLVQDFVDGEHFADLGLEDPYELVSLFQNTPDTLWLFRRPILDEWAERGDVCLADLVAHILLPELAAHFGWEDAEIAAHPFLAVALGAAKRRLSEREG